MSLEVIMFIQNSDAQLYAVDFGSGSRTILAHGGWIGSWELWTEPFTYLSENWRTVAYDHGYWQVYELEVPERTWTVYIILLEVAELRVGS